MRVNMKIWAESLVDSARRHALPILTYPGLQLTGKKVIDLVTRGDEQARCIIRLAKKYPSVAGVMVMDLSVEAEAFGASIEFRDNEVPTVSKRLVADDEAISRLHVPGIGEGRACEYIRAATLASRQVQKPVFGGMIGPYSLAGRLFDITEFMMYILMDPSASHELLAKCNRFLVSYALEYKKQGANGIIIAEPAAGLLPPDACQEFSSDYIREIVSHVQDDHFMVILHNCGNTQTLVPSMVSTGARGLSFGNAVDLGAILPQVPGDILVFGNIDPVGVLKMGNPATIRQKTLELLERTKDFPNHILSSGCDIPPGTPLENVQTFYRALEEYNRGRVSD
jgi:uroporphyrinogen decarboxylase